jgi:hypothetical protein
MKVKLTIAGYRARENLLVRDEGMTRTADTVDKDINHLPTQRIYLKVSKNVSRSTKTLKVVKPKPYQTEVPRIGEGVHM